MSVEGPVQGYNLDTWSVGPRLQFSILIETMLEGPRIVVTDSLASPEIAKMNVAALFGLWRELDVA